jgi:CBS-domain-containing membrane protein
VLSTTQNVIDWFCKEVMARSIQGVPRQAQLDAALKVLSSHP